MTREECSLQDVPAAPSGVPANGEVGELPPIRKAGPIAVSQSATCEAV